MLHRIVHSDPTCRVCRSITPGLVATAAPIPPPFPNPEHKRPTYRTPDGERDGGRLGTHWYHGTGFNPDEDGEEHHDNPGYGGELARPEGSNSEYGERAEHHWNTDLGVHFTSLKHVASEFAEKKGEAGHQRIAHATLHMANPKHFDDEEDFALDAAKWAHGAGHRFLPEHPQAHQAFVHGHYSPDDDDDEGSVEHFDEQEGKHRGYEYLHEKAQFEDHDGPREARRRISDVDVSGPKLSHGPKTLERWIGLHPDREQITQGYSDHLKKQGHDGITYGNSYEGPFGHKCAIALDHTPVHVHHWEWLNEDHPGNKAHEKPPESDPNQLAFDYHARLAAQRRRNGWKLASGGWEFNHYDISDGKGKTFRTVAKPPGDAAPAFLEYKKPQEGKVDFRGATFDLDYAHRRHGPEVANRLRQEVLDHHNATEYNPDTDAAPPEKTRQKPRIYYHGTTVPDVTHILPASRHGGGVMFPHDTSREHAYASLDKDSAWNYAEKAWHTTGEKPRVYQVRPMHGDHSHVEEDPTWDDSTGRSRGNREGDRRSRVGFEVVRELKTPQHIHDSFDWPGKEDGE